MAPGVERQQEESVWEGAVWKGTQGGKVSLLGGEMIITK